jgi:hypothetical protein
VYNICYGLQPPTSPSLTTCYVLFACIHGTRLSQAIRITKHCEYHRYRFNYLLLKFRILSDPFLNNQSLRLELLVFELR